MLVEVSGKDVNGDVVTFTVCEPKIAFSAAHEPETPGADNVRITFAPFDNTADGETKVGQYKENELKKARNVLRQTENNSKERKFI